jgi:CDP-diacylglycerol--glycerol-3-phosphate 3-phosphatidyltransferase
VDGSRFPLRHFLLPPNLLSLLRVVLVWPVVLCLKADNPRANLVLAGLVVAMTITDFLDGWLSRRLNQVTELGKLLDPLADKIAMVAGLAALIIYRRFPLPLVVVLVYRDLVILVLGLWMARRDKVPESNWWGKWNTGIVSFAAFLFILGVKNWIFWVYYVAGFILTVVSGFFYYRTGERFFIKEPSTRILLRVATLLVTAAVITFALSLPEMLA